MRTVLLAAAAAALAGCATAPENIAATPSSHPLGGLSCEDLAARQSQLDARLSSLEAAQRRTRRYDGVGLALVFLPIASLAGGNHAVEIGALKGEKDALNVERGRCGGAVSADMPIATAPGHN